MCDSVCVRGVVCDSVCVGGVGCVIVYVWEGWGV